MSLVVNTNVSSLNAQRSLSASGAELKTAMERLSSGKKINSAADDAAPTAAVRAPSHSAARRRHHARR